MDKQKQKQQKQQNTKQTPPQNHIIVKRWNSLRLRMSATNPGSHFIFSRKWSRSIASIPGYCVQGRASSTCFLFFSLQDDTPCWLPRNCTAMTCSSCRTWSYMPLRIPSSKLHRETRLTKSKETVPGRRPESPLSSVLTSSFISSPGWLDLVKSLSSHSSTEYHPGPVAIYQELLHSSSRYNATVTWKEQALQWIGKGVCTSKTTKNQEAISYRQQISWLDWRHVLCWYIAGLVSCPLGLPGHSSAPAKGRWIQDCQSLLVDQTEVPDDLRQKWHEAQANRRMQFKVGTFKSSEIYMITCTLKADSIQLAVENYLAKFPTLKQGVIAGVFKIKGASAWTITRQKRGNILMTTHHLVLVTMTSLTLFSWLNRHTSATRKKNECAAMSNSLHSSLWLGGNSISTPRYYTLRAVEKTLTGFKVLRLPRKNVLHAPGCDKMAILDHGEVLPQTLLHARRCGNTKVPFCPVERY